MAGSMKDIKLRIKSVESTMQTVSYTHLDVYKRQSWSTMAAQTL